MCMSISFYFWGSIAKSETVCPPPHPCTAVLSQILSSPTQWLTLLKLEWTGNTFPFGTQSLKPDPIS